MNTPDHEVDHFTELEQRYQHLCHAVNMDKPTMEEAWQSFGELKKNFALEGDDLHWLVCALYVKSRQSTFQSVSGNSVRGNYVSLTKLLKEGGISVMEQFLANLIKEHVSFELQANFISFLRKMEKWLEMNPNVISELRDRVKYLDHSFRVCTLIFKKFYPMFCNVFLDPEDPTNNVSTKHKSRRYRRVACLPYDVFKFCWTLFIHAKATHYRAVTEDVVSSFHLLLSCVNLCFKNALACAHRTKLLNPNFTGLPENWNQADFVNKTDLPDVISSLVQSQAAESFSEVEAKNFSLDAKVGNAHTFTNYIQSLFGSQNEVLVGDKDTLSELFDPSNFEHNRKSIDKSYEEFVLSKGDFDERIFLADNADEELGTPIKQHPKNLEIKSEVQNGEKKNATATNGELSQHLELTNFKPKTPLTNRMHLFGRETAGSTPISTAFQNLGKLQAILRGKEEHPTAEFTAMIKKCTNGDEILKILEERVNNLGKIFLTKYCEPYESLSGGSEEFGMRRLSLSKKFYYKVLETILNQEKKRMEIRQDSGSLEALVVRDDFHTLLFACCVEVVLASYQSMRSFPWILPTFNIEPFYFVKIIELVVKGEEGLSRDVVKRLNRIEEQVLESMAWKTSSPVWEAITQAEGIPSCEEARKFSTLKLYSQKENRIVCDPGGSLQVNYSHHIQHHIHGVPSARVHPRIREVAIESVGIGRMQDNGGLVHDRFSSPMPGSAKRRLFGITESDNSIGQRITIANSNVTTNPTEKPKKTGSLALFFRKVYNLSTLRIKDLCEKLSVNTETMKKVWTCFERSMVGHCEELMKDRHIDQLIMCSLYVISKVTKQDLSFQEIMRCYRQQPQASSHVYRSVLISRNIEDAATVPDTSEHREDLIQFYNKIYLTKMKDFVKKFSISASGQQLEAPLSPMPATRSKPHSPRKVMNNVNVYVSPHKSSDSSLLSRSPALEFRFQRSPSTQLRCINERLNRHTSESLKRSLDFSIGGHKPTTPIPHKLQKLQADRSNLA